MQYQSWQPECWPFKVFQHCIWRQHLNNLTSKRSLRTLECTGRNTVTKCYLLLFLWCLGSASRRCSLNSRGIAFWGPPSFARCVSHAYSHLYVSVRTNHFFNILYQWESKGINNAEHWAVQWVKLWYPDPQLTSLLDWKLAYWKGLDMITNAVLKGSKWQTNIVCKQWKLLLKNNKKPCCDRVNTKLTFCEKIFLLLSTRRERI